MFLLALLFLLACGAFSPAAHASSDLTPAIYGAYFEINATVSPGDVIEGCAGAATGRTLLRFGTRVTNLGPDDLVIGNPGCPDCQTNPGAACQDPRFVCSPGLYVAHFRSAARFELLDLNGNDVVVGSKRGYCFNDDECVNGTSPKFTSCADDQGLTVGCTDDYEPFLDCQYIDVTDVPDVMTRAFNLRVTIDTEDLLPDPNRANNVTEIALPGCGDGIVQPGEECDPGPNGASGCCDATCQLLSAGTTCHAATGPCDAAEVCDGSSAACPPDASMPDGTACAAAVQPCFSAACQAGVCQPSLAAGTCLIDGSCATAGGADPADACSECDPTRATDAWSPDIGADEHGIRCELDRVTTAVAQAACRPRVVRAIASPLRQLRRALDREFKAASPDARLSATSLRLARRLSRAVTRAGKRAGCDVTAAAAQVGVLMTQLTAQVGK